MNQSKAHENSDGPHCQEQKQRERAEECEDLFSSPIFFDSPRQRRPRSPGDKVNKTRHAKKPGYAPWQDNRFKRFPQHDRNQDYAEDADEVLHEI